MNCFPIFKRCAAFLALTTIIHFPEMASAASNAKVPDFTKSEVLDPGNPKKKIQDRTMGPTGLRGQVYSQSMKEGASRDARQWLVTTVEAGSPADGKIVTGDVVVGVEGKHFDDDARKLLAAAIQKAEASDGNLSLRIWRAGKTFDQTLRLKVMGAFDPAQPFNCAYTDGVINQMIDHVLTVRIPPEERNPNGDPYPFMSSMYALGMLATGDERLMPKVRNYAHTLCADPKTGKPVEFEVSSEGKRVWTTSYHLIFLAEYYLATRDETVLPAIQTLSIGAAKGQSGVGSYGHRFSSRKPDGSYHGPLEGYGAINNASLSMLTGIILASKCGIDDPEITAAIARGKRFFDFFVEHGGIPYGDHWAGSEYFENNGTSGLSAILFGLMNDTRGQRFFSSMAVAASPTGREEGHQGCYWSYLWSNLGAARSGEQGRNASFLETRYLHTLERGWTGQVMDQSDIGPTKYSQGRGDVTGERLLMMSLGRKHVHLAGKEMKVERPLEEKDLADTLQAGRLIYHPGLRQNLSEEDIFKFLRHELPAARIMAAKMLQERKLDRVDRLIKLLNDPDRFARYGACSGLTYAGMKSDKAVQALLARMQSDEDILFRYFAVDVFRGPNNEFGLRQVAGPAVPVLLKLATEPLPNDPRGHLCWQISEVIFYSGSSLFKLYPKETATAENLLVDSVRQFLLNENGRARSMVPLKDLTKEQLEQLWAGIYKATENNAPSGIMFSKGVRTSGMAVMAQYRIQEGLDLMIKLSKTRIERNEENSWLPWFAETMVTVLPLYGRDALPVLDIVEQWPVLEGRGQKLAEKLPELRKQIENSPQYNLVSFK